MPVLPTDTLLALAEQARLQHGCTQVVAVLDARMDEVYAAHCSWQAGGWQVAGGGSAAFAVCKPEAVQVPPGWTVAGNARAAYGERLAPQAAHVHALPTAAALLSLAPALLAAGRAVAPAHALPLYVRDKVAKTTAERAAERAGALAALALLPATQPLPRP